MNMWGVLFQGQNLYIMIGLGILVLGVSALLARRMMRRMTPEDKIYYQRRAKEQQKFALVRLIGIGILLLVIAIFAAFRGR